MVCSREVDARRRGGWFWVIGLLVDLSFLLALSAVSPLTIELDGLILPDFERGGDWIHRVDAFFDPFDEALFEHFSKRDVVMTAESRVLLDILNVLFSGIGGHCDIFEFGSGHHGGV